MAGMITRDIVAAEILRQTEARSAAKSICPSEVARALAPDEAAWRSMLGLVRSVAHDLARSGRIDVLRKGKPVDPTEDIRGVVRLRIRAPVTED
jgi:hypothetical protein